MNEDFAEILNNFSEILKEKEIDLNKITGGENEAPPDDTNFQNDFNLDINTILKIKRIIDGMNNQNGVRNQLLNSLKPYLEDTKKEKLDQYIRIANLLSVLDSFDENNSFKFLTDSNYDFVLMLILFLLIF